MSIGRTCLVACLAIVLAGCGGAVESAADLGPLTTTAEPVPTTSSVPVAPPVAAPTTISSQPVARPAPVRPVATNPDTPLGLAIPTLGVSTGPLMSLGIDAEGALDVPPDATTAGWYTLSPVPGATGPAVIAAHVDYSGVPGVFVRLAQLRPGDEVSVRRADGTEAVFTTDRVERYPKAAFPSDEVYGNTEGPELRLITCGGAFNRSTGHYDDNVVAYAHLTGLR